MAGLLDSPAQMPPQVLDAYLARQNSRPTSGSDQAPDYYKGQVAGRLGFPADMFQMATNMWQAGMGGPVTEQIPMTSEKIGGLLGADTGSQGFQLGLLGLPGIDDALRMGGKGMLAMALGGYRISHRPMTVEGGASRLHDLVGSFGEDVYGPNAQRYFGAGGRYGANEQAALKVMRKVRDNPDAEVTIYRGVPGKVDEITDGDWVTIDRATAEAYADFERRLGHGGKVISKKVKAKDVTSWPDSLIEFGYYPVGQK